MRFRLRSILALASFVLSLATAPGVQAQMGVGQLLQGGGLGGSARQAPQRATAGRILDPVSLGAPPVRDRRAPASQTSFDVAVVLLEPRGAHGEHALAEAEGYWRGKRFRVAPQSLVARKIEELGLFTPDALAAADYSRLGHMIGARYLVLVSVGSDGARRQLFGGAGARLFGAGTLLGFRGRDNGSFERDLVTPVVLIGAVALVAGVTTVATCDVSPQIYDCAAGRTVWLRSASVTKRKVLFGLFANRVELSNRARRAAVARLFDAVCGRLTHERRSVVLTDSTGN